MIALRTKMRRREEEEEGRRGLGFELIESGKRERERGKRTGMGDAKVDEPVCEDEERKGDQGDDRRDDRHSKT